MTVRVENQSIEINFAVLRRYRTADFRFDRSHRHATPRHFWNFRPSFLVSREIANCAAPAIVKKVYAGTYFTFIRSRARLNHSWPRVDIRPRSSTESPAFSYVRSNFAEKFPRGFQLPPRTSRQSLFIGRRSSLIIVNPRISSARENVPPRVIFLALITFWARRMA